MGKILLHEESEANVSDSFLKDTRANVQGRIIGLIWRKGLGTSRADISGSGRQSCEPEFNYTGYEEKAIRNESLETNNVKDSERVVRMFVEVDVVSAFSNSTKQDARNRV